MPVVSVWLILRRATARDHSVGFCFFAAIGLGLGISSLLWWGLLHLPIQSTRILAYVDLAFWSAAVMVQVAVRARRDGGTTLRAFPQRNERRAVGLSSVLFCLLLGLAVTSFASTTAVFPHGSWDAWAIWNGRARFLFLGLPDLWRQAFSPDLGWSHPDYPLLLPLTVARLWTFVGHDFAAMPVAVAAGFSASLIGVLGFSIARERSVVKALVACSFLVASPVFLVWAPSQVADVPLAFFILLALTFAWTASTSTKPSSLWALAGLSAGLAAWTKNEGIVFALIFLLIRPLGQHLDLRSYGRSILASAGGAATPLLVLVAFKFLVAPPNDLMSRSIDQLIPLLTDIERIKLVMASMGRELWTGGHRVVPILVIYLAASGVDRPLESRRTFVTLAVLGLLLGAYVVTYVTSPHDLSWHLRTSLDRVLLHVLPSLIWVGFLLTSSKGDART
jgi:hypothetical protein